jgi:hypothetical protein
MNPNKQITVGELIELLKRYDPKTPVWTRNTDDPGMCYQKLFPEYVKITTITDYSKGEGEESEVDELVFGSDVF